MRSVGWYCPSAETSAASSVSSSLSHSGRCRIIEHEIYSAYLYVCVYIYSIEQCCYLILSDFGWNQRHAVIGCWCEEDRAFPVKKRRSSFTRMPNNITEATTKIKKEERSKKSDALIANDEGDMSCTGGIAMQGVRCRRSNGRKWRCWQPSIEGYTHCKYHLDQARVRNRRCRDNQRRKPRQAASRSTELKRAVTSSYIEDDEEYHDRDDNDYSGVFEVGKNTRRGVGFGKARSISSLLARTVPLLGAGDSLVQHDP